VTKTALATSAAPSGQVTTDTYDAAGNVYTGDDPVNGVDPLGLSWYDPSWAHTAVHRLARGVDKVSHFVSTHKKAAIVVATIIATLPLDETGIGEAIDADVIGGEATADVTADVVGDEAANEVAEEGAQEEAEQEVADNAPSCGAQSFTPDTEVQLANGAKIPISQVRVGDMVLATDTATGKTQAEPVTTLWVNHDNDLMDVTVKTASGTSTIKSTQHHLFWDLTTKTWTQAEDLAAGTGLQTPNGATATVVATTVVPGAADMWDLTVNNDHDFYVVVSAGSQIAVLVHNCPDLYHGTDADSASDIAENGLSHEAAGPYGGDGGFYMTEDLETARTFAAANPAESADTGIVGITFNDGLDSAVSRGIISRVPTFPGVYSAEDWEALNSAARFTLEG
jgi:hypothetical protein